MIYRFRKAWVALLAASVMLTSGVPAMAATDTATDTALEGTITEDQSVAGDIEVESKTDTEKEVTGEVNQDDDVEIEADDTPYIAFGEDLTQDQKNTVLSLMGVDASKLGDYHVETVSNKEEHQYLDDYLSSDTIGTKALSSVVIVKRKSGNGLNISTKNINYCTIGMYKNALATAGLKDADIIVAGPFNISGTAALIGAMKAYADMEGTTVDEKSLDAAMNELVVTGELSQDLGATDGETEEFVAYLKQKVLEDGLKDSDSISEAVDAAADKYGFTLTADEKQQLVDMLLKISKLDLDVDSLMSQAKSLYNQLGAAASDSGFFAKVVDAIVTFFQNLFSMFG